MDSLHVLFSDEGHPVAIRKWSQEPFEGGEEYVRKSDFADLIAACDAVLEKEKEIAELKFEAGMKDKAIRLALKRLKELTDQTGTGALFASDIALIRQVMKETSDGLF